MSTEARDTLLREYNCNPDNIRQMSSDDIASMLASKLEYMDHMTGISLDITMALIDLLTSIQDERNGL